MAGGKDTIRCNRRENDFLSKLQRWINWDQEIDKKKVYYLTLITTPFSILEKLEKKFPEGLAVIGVHSAKFQNEKSEFQLENAIKR